MKDILCNKSTNLKWPHLAQFFGTIVAMPGSSHQIWLAELLAQLYYQSSLSELSLIATLGLYVVLLSFLMQVNFNYRVNENFVSHRTLLRKTCLIQIPLKIIEVLVHSISLGPPTPKILNRGRGCNKMVAVLNLLNH